jgi:hypothetical protein
MNLDSSVATHFFQTKKYIIIRGLLDPKLCEIVTDALLESKNKVNDSQCPLSKAIYSLKEVERLMPPVQEIMEEINGQPLLPTYSYARVYQPGEVLEYHTDRPACEISISINLGQSGDDFRWPLWYANPDNIAERGPAVLDPGDALMYHGMIVPHWRDKFEPPRDDDWQTQCFLHYVNKIGPHANQEFDGRKGLNL